MQERKDKDPVEALIEALRFLKENGGSVGLRVRMLVGMAEVVSEQKIDVALLLLEVAKNHFRLMKEKDAFKREALAETSRFCMASAKELLERRDKKG